MDFGRHLMYLFYRTSYLKSPLKQNGNDWLEKKRSFKKIQTNSSLNDN